MAGNESTVSGQTELLTGWSCVVHRPSEDPEPSSLPSTVDIAAFSSGPSVAPSQSIQNDCCSNSDSDSASDSENSVSDASGSCSYSSTDTDSSSSSQASSSSSIPPQFSVTSSQTGGLRLTIATVRKSCNSPSPKEDSQDKTPSGEETKPAKVADTNDNSINSVIKNVPKPKLSSSDSESDGSDSDSSSNSESRASEKKLGAVKRDSPAVGRVKCLRKVNNKNSKQSDSKVENIKKSVKSKDTPSKVPPKVAVRSRGRPPGRTNKMASLPLARVQSPHATSSDSEDSVSDSDSAMLASCSLQEIRQEDLAAILPDQQDCDAFGGFECEARAEKPEVDVGDASGSDMELPTQLVNAAIQRVTTESSSETDSQPAIYASTLLQQFVQQAQLLNNSGTSGSTINNSSDNPDKQSSSTGNAANDGQLSENPNGENVKRKRGRPRKNLSKKAAEIRLETSQHPNTNNLLNAEYCGEPNVSPDSGIQNSPDHLSSPEPSPSPNVRLKPDQNKIKLPKSRNTEACMHDRKVKSSSKTSSSNIGNKASKKEIVIQKVVQKQKMALTCNNLDRVLYANSDRVLYPPRRKVGRPAGKLIRKPGRPPKSTSLNNSTKHTVSSTKTESSRKVQSGSSKNVSKNAHKGEKRRKKKRSNKTPSDNDIVQLTSNTLSLSLGKQSDLKKSDISSNVNSVPKKIKPSGALLNEICERVSKRLELSNKYPQTSTKPVLQSTANEENASKPNHSKDQTKNEKPPQRPKCVALIKNKTKLNIFKSRLNTFKHMKVMHTKHCQKHKKHKIKILKTLASETPVPAKIDPDIDKLINDFVKYCNLGTSKSQKENCPEIFRCVKKLSKKRKGLESSDGRKKKKQTSVNNGESKETNSNEQRLPLKKRHYHMSASNENKNSLTISTNSSTINETISKEKDESLTKQNNDIKPKTMINPKIIQKNEPDNPPNKSPTSQTSTTNNNNKSVLVMNHKTQPVAKSSTNTNNNIYNNRKPAESEDLIGTHIDEAIEACITKYTLLKTIANNTIKQPEVEIKSVPVEVKKSVTSMTATTPKKRHRMEAENIENNYNTQVIDRVTKKLETSVNNLKITETTLVDSKPNLMENITEIKNNKKSLPSAPSPDPTLNNNNKKYNDKKIETVAQMITRKKNRLEDLTSNLVSKINPTPTSPVEETPTVTAVKKLNKKTEEEIVPEMVTRASVIKSPIIKKVKSSETDKLLDSIVEDKPTGIFMQTVDLELRIPTSTVNSVQDDSPVVEKSENSINQHNLRNKKVQEPVETADIKPTKKTKLLKDVIVQVEKLKPSELPIDKYPVVEKNSTPVIADLNNQTSTVVIKKKVRRRKAINRTGFPTLKKKKKKLVVTKPVKTEKVEIDSNIYDRVPRLGEEASTFMKRTQDCTLSVVALEKLQTKPETISTPSEADLVSKWEISSECDSLPMDECTFTSELESSKHIKMERLDIKQERMSLRLRDVSPSTSVETRFSDRVRKMTRDSTPDSKICIHRTRESSVGSVQTLPDDSERNVKRKRDYSGDKIDKKKRLYDFDYLKYSKKRFRDVSPSSSVEPLPSDKKQRSDSVASSSGDDFKRCKKIPRWRKKYLVAGLFSDYYKEDDESVRTRRESACTKTKLVYNPSEHHYGLLPPPYHCGKYLRCRKIPFKLPYDLWWQHTHSQLPGRDMVPSWNYRKIRTNVYCIRNTSGACEPQACNCTSTSRCEDDCINRLVLAECPSTHRCRNQRIQKHEWAPGLEKFMTENKGWGVRTKLSIKSGDFILEYVGEVVADQEFKHRMATRYAHDIHHYCLHLDGGLVIDGHRMGGDGRFVNHSCQPNCEIQKWSVNGQFRMALFALRDISADEELTYDYNFSLFNAAEGQVCKCGSNNCRGVIGGKSQRVRQTGIAQSQSIVETNNNQSGRVGRPRKNQARKTTTNGPAKEVLVPTNTPQPVPIIVTPHVKPMSHQQKCFALQHHCFLLRNLNKVKRLRERPVASVTRAQTQTPVENSNVFINQLNALRQPRNMRTRRLAQVEDNPELNKAAKLASILKDLYEAVTTAKDENKSVLCTPFMMLPSKRKHPEYYQRISDPIDLNTIEQNIATGVYRTVKAFDTDMIKLFTNSVRFFGRTSDLGIAATRLRKVYGQGKIDYLSRLEDVLGEKAPANFVSGKDPGDEEEDVIRCICGLYRDEGLMIQCERCLVWQHCECVRANPDAASYHCERCVPRKVDLEIPLDEYNEDGHRYYVSLLRGDLQLRQSDTVYVLRDIPIPGTDKKHTYDTVGDVNYSDLDIFRIERMWKDSKTGQRFAFGHHYLRPHETYHEPTRKFFPNEVMRVPLYEVVPIELIMSLCWVLDMNTYCKGRPFSSSEEHVYICEYRVDKTARLFSKISKSKYPVCTKSYAFDRFDARLKISRTFIPHELNNVQVKPRGRRPHDAEEQSTSKEILTQVQVPVIRIRSREEQRAHLNSILLRLLGRLPTKQTLDVSYLLEGGRRRKKQQS